MSYEKILPSQEPDYRMAYTRKFLLALESICDVDASGNVIIPHSHAHTFYEELRRCQEMMQIRNDGYTRLPPVHTKAKVNDD